MRTRSRLASAAAVLALAACASPSVGVEPVVLPHLPGVRDLTADQQVKQAASRLTLGPRPGEVTAIQRVGLDEWIVRQLQPERIDDHAADSLMALFPVEHDDVKALVDSFPPLDLFIRNLKKERGLAPNAPFVPDSADSARYKVLNDRGNRYVQQILAAKMARSVMSERELLEVMTDFWENHFSVCACKLPTRFSLLEYDRDVIRPHALGRFRDLLEAVAKSPEMLYYLDNWQSRADSMHLSVPELRAVEGAKTLPARERVYANARRRRAGLNENYARELMELHTLGVDGGYTQQDVIEVARALTGWTIDDPRAGGGFVFRPAMHDAEPKVVLGHRLAAGRGLEDGEEVLDIVARSPATARFISTKLARRFVSDNPPASLVSRMAATYMQTGGDIRQVLATLFASPEFYSRRSWRAKVKSPFELVVSTLRAMDARPDTTPKWVYLPARLGEPTFGHLTPEGWPETGDAWMNTGALLERINFGMQVGAGRLPGVPLARWPPADSLRRLPLAAQVDGLVNVLLEGEASVETRAILLSGRNPLLGPSDAEAPVASGAMTQPAANPRIGFPDLVGLALGSPEFQRR